MEGWLCLEAFKVFKVQREKVVGAKHTLHRLRERKRDLTKKIAWFSGCVY